MTENGPCYVTDNGNDTVRNPHSRNNKVNVLYVDQPVGAGFSYTTRENVTYSQLDGSLVPTDFSNGIPYTPNITVFPGTVSNQSPQFQSNNSNIAAKVMWHFAQVWFDEFPIYHPKEDRISLWTNSVSPLNPSTTIVLDIEAECNLIVWRILRPGHLSLVAGAE